MDAIPSPSPAAQLALRHARPASRPSTFRPPAHPSVRAPAQLIAIKFAHRDKLRAQATTDAPFLPHQRICPAAPLSPARCSDSPHASHGGQRGPSGASNRIALLRSGPRSRPCRLKSVSTTGSGNELPVVGLDEGPCFHGPPARVLAPRAPRPLNSQGKHTYHRMCALHIRDAP
ncbi:hypothetical protein BN946_scf184843.g27 [Trametes cinnabarina]|uniref:Uncharacterized protein n=1 Tax=Pycnoporus cinnabarinus TaxID=5643 RepID=A0A060SD89_PYCCI|nr:hypothetical protein BN946_scf184843.g27 [Trametes cinnabarina]